MGLAHASAVLGFGFMGMEVMVRSHGVLNGSAVLLAAVALTAAQRASR